MFHQIVKVRCNILIFLNLKLFELTSVSLKLCCFDFWISFINISKLVPNLFSRFTMWNFGEYRIIETIQKRIFGFGIFLTEFHYFVICWWNCWCCVSIYNWLTKLKSLCLYICLHPYAPKNILLSIKLWYSIFIRVGTLHDLPFSCHVLLECWSPQ